MLFTRVPFITRPKPKAGGRVLNPARFCKLKKKFFYYNLDSVDDYDNSFKPSPSFFIKSLSDHKCMSPAECSRGVGWGGGVGWGWGITEQSWTIFLFSCASTSSHFLCQHVWETLHPSWVSNLNSVKTLLGSITVSISFNAENFQNSATLWNEIPIYFIIIYFIFLLFFFTNFCLLGCRWQPDFFLGDVSYIFYKLSRTLTNTFLLFAAFFSKGDVMEEHFPRSLRSLRPRVGRRKKRIFFLQQGQLVGVNIGWSKKIHYE